jgi:hypothetical protein
MHHFTKILTTHVLLTAAYSKYLNEFIVPECPETLDVQPDYYSPMTPNAFKNLLLINEEFNTLYGTGYTRKLDGWERVAWVMKNKPELMGRVDYLDGDGKGCTTTNFNNVPKYKFI